MAKKNLLNNPALTRRFMTQERGGKSDTGAPQFPGQSKGLSIEQVRKLISNQPRETGFLRSLATGNTIISDLKLPGDSKLLLGINFNLAVLGGPDDRFTFSVNNNKIIDNAAVVLNSTQPGFGGIAITDEPYVPLMQPLSGQDDLELEYVTAAVGARVQFVLWYI